MSLRKLSNLWKNQNIQKILGVNFNKIASNKSLHVTGGKRHLILSVLKQIIYNVYILIF
jgi:hypothetical protein